MPVDMESLALRVEAGAGADAELTEDIARALGWTQSTEQWRERWWCCPGTQEWQGWLPRWLESLDSAASLALPEWIIGDIHQSARGDRWFCRAVLFYAWYLSADAIAPTEPRARTAAWLRARAAAQPATGEK